VTDETNDDPMATMSDEVLARIAEEYRDSDEEVADAALTHLIGRDGPMAPEASLRRGLLRRRDDPDSAPQHLADFRAALAADDPEVLARAHAEVGYTHLKRSEFDEAVPHLRVAMASDSEDEPMESALYLGQVLIDPGEAERCFRVALGHPDRVHRAEAALECARLRAESDPGLAIVLARYAYATGEGEDRDEAAELLDNLGQTEPALEDDAPLPDGVVLPPKAVL
jgi:tetratricopeptide (TPR) repeat protein